VLPTSRCEGPGNLTGKVPGVSETARKLIRCGHVRAVNVVRKSRCWSTTGHSTDQSTSREFSRQALVVNPHPSRRIEQRTVRVRGSLRWLGIANRWHIPPLSLPGAARTPTNVPSASGCRLLRTTSADGLILGSRKRAARIGPFPTEQNRPGPDQCWAEATGYGCCPARATFPAPILRDDPLAGHSTWRSLGRCRSASSG